MTKRIRFKHILTIVSIIIAAAIATAVYANTGSQERVGQIYLHQEAVKNQFIDKYQEETSFIVPSASDAVTVSVNVLDNLSLSVRDSQPEYATNWPYGATLHEDHDGKYTINWTVTADY